MRGTKPGRKIEESIERDGAIRRGERVVIACSGGPDSVALAAILHAVSKPMRLMLTLGHVNHGTRASAWQDEAVVLSVGGSLGLPVRIERLRLTSGDEATLRDARYAALSRLAANVAANVVATGHTAGDQTETVLLALFRGTGPTGIAGMSARRPLNGGAELARPLLRFTRADLLAYAGAKGLPYALDPTNADVALRRNALRQALEALRPVFPRLDEAVARAAQLAADERDRSAPALLRRRIRSALHEEAVGGVDFAHVEAAVRALEEGRRGSFWMAPGVEVEVKDGALEVRRQS